MSNKNITDNTLKIDFGDSMAASGTVDYSGIDTITLTGASDTIDLTGAQGSTFNYNYNNVANWSSSNWSTGSILTGSNTFNNAKVKIDESGIDMDDGADIKIGHRSLRTFMEKMEERLAILQPDPALLEKYEALKQAYEHYRTLEALCMGDPPKDPNRG